VPALWRSWLPPDADRVHGRLRNALADPNVARLLALFGDDDDHHHLARAATALWTDEAPPLEPVFWRPAGRAPALGKFSFLEVYLEAAFGSDRRFRILSQAYAIAATAAEAGGDGGTAARYAYEAFLLAPDDPEIGALLERLNRLA
jgi:hypothetical protein